MHPTICNRCKKNVAVIFVTKVENGVSTNEGLCLKCARELKIKPVEDLMQKMNLTDEDLDNLTDEMMEAMSTIDGSLIPVFKQAFRRKSGGQRRKTRRWLCRGPRSRAEARRTGKGQEKQIFGQLLNFSDRQGALRPA